MEGGPVRPGCRNHGAAPGHRGLLALLLLGVGHRPSLPGVRADRRLNRPSLRELAAFRTDDLDTLRRTLRSTSSSPAGLLADGPLKSKNAYRTIGLPAFLLEELAAHLAAYPSGSDLVFSHG